MKKYILILLTALYAISCNNEFEPYAEFRERYVLNCIINCDSTTQIATLSKSYRPNGVDPLEYKNEYFIKGADVKIWSNNLLFPLKDSILQRVNNERFKTPYNFYYTNNLSPVHGTTIEIEALLPNGLLLSSSAVVPPRATFIMSKDFPGLQSGRFPVEFEKIAGYYYLSRMSIEYYENSETTSTYKTKVFPLWFNLVNGESVPNYGTPKAANIFYYYFKDIEQIFKEIQKPETIIYLKKMYVDVFTYNEDLAKYFSSVEQSNNGFSVLLNAPDASNIKGGFGIFGIVNSTRLALEVNRDYITKLGIIPAY